jgi:hypothetical protein
LSASDRDYISITYARSLEAHVYPNWEVHYVYEGARDECLCDPELMPVQVKEGLAEIYMHRSMELRTETEWNVEG